MFAQLRPAVVLLVLLTIVTGGVYPLLVTGVAQIAFPSAANGSVIVRDNKAVGSKLIGQPFAAPKYFWPRASGTSPYPYNASSSSGTNLGPTNQVLADAVSARIKALRDADPGNTASVPVDLVTASGSGLDPHISPAAAEYQVGRVARTRNLDPQKVRDLVTRHTEDRQWTVFGEPRVNVLELNLALDATR
jgi:K+-transporting ATPase ATPase C chain